MSFRGSCFFFHKWSRWEAIAWGDLTKGKEGKIVDGFYIRQKRHCEDCGKLQLRLEKAQLSSWSS
jgi:hypothetical protein